MLKEKAQVRNGSIFVIVALIIMGNQQFIILASLVILLIVFIIHAFTEYAENLKHVILEKDKKLSFSKIC